MDYKKYIKTKRWNDPIEDSDGWRLLICRYRPRGLLKKNETWDTWWKILGPSPELHADAYGKFNQPISRTEYKKRYLMEMQSLPSLQAIKFIREYIKRGHTITLLCSSACINAEKCHRSILKEIIAGAANTIKVHII
jgi:uncharacterized protein YeaO (DUF488 family)